VEGLQSAKVCFLKSLEICQNSHLALYNLACVESLLGNVDEAVLQLKNAINSGYDDLEHLVGDEDFVNIRNTPGFEECINFLSERKNERNTYACHGLRRKLFWLHRKALKLMKIGSEECLTAARELLVHSLSLQPNEPIALYNLACTESLLGNIQESIEQLKNAINAGYNNIQHMLGDSDFENIKHTEGFSECVDLIAKEISNLPEETQPAPEETQSETNEVQPTPEETQPTLEETLPTLEETQPTLEETQPTPEETQPEESTELAILKKLLLEMGIFVDDEICARFQNDIAQIVNHYFSQ